MNFGGVYQGQDPQMCTFGVLGLSCDALIVRALSNVLCRKKKKLGTGETLFRTGNRIIPLTARVKQSEWLQLKLPLQTCPVSSEIHPSIK